MEDLNLSATNEDISILPLAVAGEAPLSSNGGSVEFGKLAVGKSLSVAVKNGNISGSLEGAYADFSISCEQKKGKTNLPEEKSDGEKRLEISSHNGDVDIEFV